MPAQDIILSSVSRYFSEHTDKLQLLCDICSGQSVVSLRLLDWLCTNYAKSTCNSFTDESNVELYHKYKNNLKGFGKRYFDPFCRRQTFEFKVSNVSMKTTAGQLNFFKWCFENKVVDFAIQHKALIDTHMNSKMRQAKRAPKKRRMHLSTLASNHCHKRLKRIRVSFS